MNSDGPEYLLSTQIYCSDSIWQCSSAALPWYQMYGFSVAILIHNEGILPLFRELCTLVIMPL